MWRDSIGGLVGLLAFSILAGCGGRDGSTELSGPSLKADSLTPSVTAVLPGGGVTLTLSVTNDGDVSSGDFTVELFESTGDSLDINTDTLLETLNEADLAAYATRLDISYVWTAPAAVGTYYIFAVVVPGAESGDTSGGVKTARSPALSVSRPNIEAVSVAFSASPAQIGERVTVNRVIANSGGIDAGAFAVQYYLSDDDVLDTVADINAGSETIGGLAAGANDDGSFELDWDAVFGVWNVFMVVDSEGVIAELDETDNTAIGGLTLTVAGPDLEVTSVTLAGTSVNVGSKLGMDRTVENTGTHDAGAFALKYYISASGTLDEGTAFLGKTESVASLAAGGNDVASVEIDVPSQYGSYHVFVVIDPLSVVETDTANNQFYAGAVDVLAPDIAVTFVEPGASVTLSGTSTLAVDRGVQNIGNANAEGVSVRYSISTDPDFTNSFLIGTELVGDVAAGITATGAYVSDILPRVVGGDYYVKATSLYVDQYSSNDSLRSATTVTLLVPDLSVAISKTISTVQQNSTFTVSYTASNTGNLQADNVSISIRASADDQYDDSDYELASENLGAIAAAGTSEGSFGVSIPTVGTYYLVAKVDVADSVYESDETNNTAAAVGTLNVTEQEYPDLVGSVTEIPPALYIGSQFDAKVTVLNQGSAESPACSGKLWLSTNQTVGGGDIDLGTYTIPALTVHEEAKLTFTFTAPSATVGSYYILWQVDSGLAVDEEDETNNASSSASTTPLSGNPDLEARGTTGPAVPAVCPHLYVRALTEYTLTSAFGEANNVPVPYPFGVGLYVAQSENIVMDGTMEWLETVSGLTAGGENSVEFKVTPPLNGVGDVVYIGAKVDAADAIPETDETDASNVDTLSTGLVKAKVFEPACGPGEYDLVAIYGDSPGSVKAGMDFALEVMFQSRGDLPAASFRIDVYAWPEGQTMAEGTVIGSTFVTAEDGVFDSIYVQCTAPATIGGWNWAYILNADEVITEVTRDNNVFTGHWPFWTTADSMFDVELGVGDGPQTPFVELDHDFLIGYSVQLTWESTTASGPITINFYASADDVITTGDTLIGSVLLANGLIPGERPGDGMTSLWATARVDSTDGFAAGSQIYLGAIASVAGDSDLSNNTAVLRDTRTLLAAGTGAPDPLGVMYLDFSGGDEPGTDSPTFVVETGAAAAWPLFVALNFGTRGFAADTVMAEVYLSTDEIVDSGDTVISSFMLPALEAGEYKFVMDPFTLSFAGIAAGTYYMYSVIDPENNLAELVIPSVWDGEANNSSHNVQLGPMQLGTFVPVEVVVAGAGGPDIVAKLRTERSWGWNEQLQLRVSSTNASLDHSAATSIASIWVSGDAIEVVSAGDECVGSCEVGFLAPGANYESLIQVGSLFDRVAQGASMWLKAFSDAADEVVEHDETNNVSVLQADCLLKEGFETWAGVQTAGWTVNGTGWLWDAGRMRVDQSTSGTVISELVSPAFDCGPYSRVIVMFRHDYYNLVGNFTVRVQQGGNDYYAANFWGEAVDGQAVIDISEYAATKPDVKVVIEVSFNDAGVTYFATVDDFVVFGFAE